MYGGAYGRVRNGGGGSAPRLVIAFALVMAVAAFLSWSTSPPPQAPSAKRLASNSGLVRGTIGQAENMGSVLGAASASVVANAKAAALQDPSANAGAGKGINEGAADITDGMAVFDGSSARAAGPIPSNVLTSSAAAVGIRGSNGTTSKRNAATEIDGIADAVAAGQAGGFKRTGSVTSGQQDAAQKKQAGAVANIVSAAAGGAAAVKEQAADLPAKVGAAAGSLKEAVADTSKAAGSSIQGAVAHKAAAGSTGGSDSNASASSDSNASASKANEAADNDYADAGLDVDGDGLDSMVLGKTTGSGAASKDLVKDAAAGGQGAAGSAGSRAGGLQVGSDATAAGSGSAGKAAGAAAGSRTSPENELVLQSAGAGGAAKVAADGQGGGSMQLPEGVDALE